MREILNEEDSPTRTPSKFRVTEDSAREDKIIYMLEAIDQTARPNKVRLWPSGT